jgi:hypothetical protein
VRPNIIACRLVCETTTVKTVAKTKMQVVAKKKAVPKKRAAKATKTARAPVKAKR